LSEPPPPGPEFDESSPELLPELSDPLPELSESSESPDLPDPLRSSDPPLCPDLELALLGLGEGAALSVTRCWGTGGTVPATPMEPEAIRYALKTRATGRITPATARANSLILFIGSNATEGPTRHRWRQATSRQGEG
jgi:hypothetical protein